MSKDNNKNYYLKYLKYKKRYLDLVDQKKKSSIFVNTSGNSGLINNSLLSPRTSPIIPLLSLSPSSSPNIFLPPRIVSVTQPTMISSKPTFVPSKPTFVPSNTSFVPSNTSFVPITALTPNNYNPIQPILTTSNYNDFDTAFDIVNKTFLRNEFLNKFNLYYNNYPVKTFKGKTVDHYIQEKSLVENTLRENGILLTFSTNSYDIMMNRLLNMKLSDVYKQLQLQNLIKNFIVLETIINILQ